MTVTLKINARNDIHLPANLIRFLNLGDDRVLKVQVKENALVLIPVDLEPRYSHEEIEGLEKLHQDEKKKGWTYLKTPKDIDNFLK